MWWQRGYMLCFFTYAKKWNTDYFLNLMLPKPCYLLSLCIQMSLIIQVLIIDCALNWFVATAQVFIKHVYIFITISSCLPSAMFIFKSQRILQYFPFSHSGLWLKICYYFNIISILKIVSNLTRMKVKF